MSGYQYRLCPNGYHVHPGQSCGCGCGSFFGDLLVFEGIADNNMGDVFMGEMLGGGGGALGVMAEVEVIDDLFGGGQQSDGYDQDQGYGNNQQGGDPGGGFGNW